MILQPSETIDQFRIIKMLGQGGMGEVYLAEDTKLNRQVAIKILQANLLNKPEQVERFTREARTAAQISHANVMSIFDLDRMERGSDGQKLSYIVMEYIQGQPLSDYIASRQPAMTETLRLVQRIASGLAAAHKLNIVHRDIKSENILIDEQGEPKILDFGLAKPIDALFGEESGDSTNTVSQELTQEGKILGTISYMSPEQARGEAVDTRSDIFSFGIMLYKMFAGKSPFEAADRVSVLAKILESRQEPLRQINQSIPAELERIVDKCLQKDRRDRYQDTRDLVIDLRHLRRQYDSGISDTVTTSEIEAAAARSSKSVSKVVRLPWWGVAAAAAAVVLTVVAVAWFAVDDSPDVIEDPEAFASNLQKQLGEALSGAGISIGDAVRQIPGVAERKNALAILGFENKTGDAELDWLSAGLPEILMTDLAQGGTANIISQNRVLDCLAGSGATEEAHTHEAFVKAARSLGASKILSGSYFKLGEKIRIDARLEDARTGQIVLAEKVVGEDPFEMVDSLTSKIASSMDGIQLGSSGQEVTAITSSSPEAYKQYILGMKAWEQGQEEATDFFEEAIKHDSSFALPWMRLGVAYGLRGRGQQAAPKLQAALDRQDKLPIKDKLLLDIYSDIWLRTQFDDAVIKLASYVQQYPDDKEVRAIHALVQYQLRRNKEAAMMQMDTVMMIDPHYYWALVFYDQIYRNSGMLDSAIAVNERLLNHFPHSKSGYAGLIELYLDQGRTDDAIQVAQNLLENFPNNGSGLRSMYLLKVLKRDFDDAEEYLELLREHQGSDPFEMISYHNSIANLRFWEGRIKDGLASLHRRLSVAREMGDSSQIQPAYDRIASVHNILGSSDSALYYVEMGHGFASGFQGFSFPIMMVEINPDRHEEARKIFRPALDNFKSRVPQEMWPLADALEGIFEATCASDTAAQVEALASLCSMPGVNSSGDLFTWGKLAVLTGQSADGCEVLTRVISGDMTTSFAPRWLLANYYCGVAAEALGDRDKAIEYYQVMLRYWGSADIEAPEVRQARERLDRLTG